MADGRRHNELIMGICLAADRFGPGQTAFANGPHQIVGDISRGEQANFPDGRAVFQYAAQGNDAEIGETLAHIFGVGAIFEPSKPHIDCLSRQLRGTGRHWLFRSRGPLRFAIDRREGVGDAT